jgi:ADP-dependent phosphofructokinase/glucokinase
MTTFNSLDEVHTAIQGMTTDELTQLIKLAEKEYNDNIITKEQAMETIEYALIVLLGKFELPKH